MGSFNFNQPKSKKGNRPQFHQRSSSPVPFLYSNPVPKFRNNNRDMVLGSKSQVSVSSARTNPLCQECDRHHQDELKVGSDVYFGYGKLGHQIRDFWVFSQKGRDTHQQGQSHRLLVLSSCPT